MKKRLLSILLALSLALTLLPGTALAEKDADDVSYKVTGGNIYFDKATGTITDCDETVTAADIPSKIEGIPVTSIGDYAFYDCRSLINVVIPNGVTSIGERTFENCSSLTSMDIPSSVTTIGSYAFMYCSGMTSVGIPESVISIGEDAFFGCKSLTTISVAGANPSYSSSDGVLFDEGQKTLIKYPAARNGNYHIPETVTSIEHYAFYLCEGLTDVVIPDSVISIDYDAFCYCSNLTSMIIPGSVTSIGNDAFNHCTGLTSIVIPDSVTSVGDGAFAYCNSLTSVVISDSVTSIEGKSFKGCSSLTSVVIPNDVEFIWDEAFYGCSSLTSVVIPDSVSIINLAAFDVCDNIKDVYYGGSKEQWNQISINDYNDSLTSAIIHYNYTGETDKPTTPDPGMDFSSYFSAYHSHYTLPSAVFVKEGTDISAKYQDEFVRWLVAKSLPQNANGRENIVAKLKDILFRAQYRPQAFGGTSMADWPLQNNKEWESVITDNVLGTVDSGVSGAGCASYAFFVGKYVHGTSGDERKLSGGTSAANVKRFFESYADPGEAVQYKYSNKNGAGDHAIVFLGEDATGEGFYFLSYSGGNGTGSSMPHDLHLGRITYQAFAGNLNGFLSIRDTNNGTLSGGGTQKPVSYTVNFFDQQTGEQLRSSLYQSGDTLGSLPTPPVHSGYTFQGWYDASGKAVSASTKVTGNMTIYARYEKTATGPSGPSEPSGSAFSFDFAFGGLDPQTGDLKMSIVVYMNGIELLTIPLTLHLG